MKRMLLAFSLMMVAFNAQPAAFHLKDVTLGTLQLSGNMTPGWGNLTGYVQFDRPFQELSCRAPRTGGVDVNTPKANMTWDIKVRDAHGSVVDRFTTDNSGGIQETGGNTFREFKTLTSFEFGTSNPDPNDGRIVKLSFIASIGSEFDKATIPLATSLQKFSRCVQNPDGPIQ